VDDDEDPWSGTTSEEECPHATAVVATHEPEPAEFLASTASAVAKLPLVSAFKRRALVVYCLLDAREAGSAAAPLREAVESGAKGEALTFLGIKGASASLLPCQSLRLL